MLLTLVRCFHRVPSHEDSSQWEFGIYTSCTKSLFFSFLVLDLRALCFLATAPRVRYRVPRGRKLLLEHWESWEGLSSHHCLWIFPGSRRMGHFNIKLGETLWGRSMRFSALLRGSSLQKVAKGPLSGPAHEGRQWHPGFDPSTTALEHLLSPSRSTSLCVLQRVSPEDGHISTKPPTRSVPSSLPQPPHPHIAASKARDEGLGKRGALAIEGTGQGGQASGKILGKSSLISNFLLYHPDGIPACAAVLSNR